MPPHSPRTPLGRPSPLPEAASHWPSTSPALRLRRTAHARASGSELSELSRQHTTHSRFAPLSLPGSAQWGAHLSPANGRSAGRGGVFHAHLKDPLCGAAVSHLLPFPASPAPLCSPGGPHCLQPPPRSFRRPSSASAGCAAPATAMRSSCMARRLCAPRVWRVF